MPAPFTTIKSTITVTDSNGVLVSNASAITVKITFPDLSVTNLSMVGGTVFNLGQGQYMIKYATKAAGPTKELWNVTSSDGITVASAQFDVGVGY